MSASRDERVYVAVRVRPFNQREEKRNCQLIIEMEGNATVINSPTDFNDRKVFTFDRSYWSFDGFKTDTQGRAVPDLRHANGQKYCDQQRIFSDLGQIMLKNVLDGYNTTLFAYGQTGSGKSYSVIGYGPNKGLVPNFGRELFRQLNERTSDRVQFQVYLSMIEIYNEMVRDLLDPSKSDKGLKVREHPKKGFYAEGLKVVRVHQYDDIEQLMNQGTINRTVASTNMNATSSRAHTIVSITVLQKRRNHISQETTFTSIVNIVDLAGSERLDSTVSNAERLKEGAAINQSLSCLGNCIHALAESSTGKATRVPYRDSVLTKLLMNALGGNSKTIMIASISPADINYEETLSTLRYADRAKQIKTKATVNEDPTDKLLRDLKKENQRLKTILATGKLDPEHARLSSNGRSATEVKAKWEEDIRAQLHENMREIQELEKWFEERRKKNLNNGNIISIEPKFVDKSEVDRRNKPHLFNINMDPLLNGRLVHILEEGITGLGKKPNHYQNIQMVGPGMQENHAEIIVDHNQVRLRPLDEDCRVLINGTAIQSETVIHHNDRLVFGSTQMWIYQNLNESSEIKPDLNYEYVLQEIAANSGFNITATLSNKAEAASLHEELVATMPLVEEANSISAELDKQVKFEIVLIAPQIFGKDWERSEVYIKMKHLEHGWEYLWPKSKFLNRLYVMKDMFQRYVEGEETWDLPEDRDPFLEPPDTVVVIGTARIFLQSLCYLVDLREQLEITDFRGMQKGLLEVEINPCDSQGQEFSETEDVFIDNPQQLRGRNVYYNFKLLACHGLPNKFTDIHCKYRLFQDEEDTLTDFVPQSTDPVFNHCRLFKCEPVTSQLIDYMCKSSVVVEVLGRYATANSGLSVSARLTTRQLLRADRRVFSRTTELMAGLYTTGRPVDFRKQELLAKLLLVKKTQIRLQQRLSFIRRLVTRFVHLKHEQIPTELLNRMLNDSLEQAEQILQNLEGDWETTDREEVPGTTRPSSSVCTIF